MKNQKQIRAPFLEVSKIKSKADNFRSKHWGDSVPIDIENIIDFKLKIKLIPVPSLRYQCDTEAGISSNWKYMYVDKDSYEDERNNSRLRFSLAHEIGHFVLHKDVYQSLGIYTFDDYYEFTVEQSENGCKFHKDVEIQANIFANILLVPRENLYSERERILQKNKEKLKDIIPKNKQLVDSYLAKELAPTFDVSEEVLNIALNNVDKDLGIE